MFSFFFWTLLLFFQTRFRFFSTFVWFFFKTSFFRFFLIFIYFWLFRAVVCGWHFFDIFLTFQFDSFFDFDFSSWLFLILFCIFLNNGFWPYHMKVFYNSTLRLPLVKLLLPLATIVKHHHVFVNEPSKLSSSNKPRQKAKTASPAALQACSISVHDRTYAPGKCTFTAKHHSLEHFYNNTRHFYHNRGFNVVLGSEEPEKAFDES